MPLDFSLAILQFAEQLAAQVQRAFVAERAILPRLIRRRDATRRAEWAVRDLPFLRFEGGALVLRLAPFQAGVLAAVPGDSGLDRALEPFRPDSQESAIGRFALALDPAALALVDSLERTETVTPQMFDARGAGGVAGLAALGWRTLGEATRRGEDVTRMITAGRHAYLRTTRAPSELDVFTGQLRDALTTLGYAPAAAGEPTSPDDLGLTIAAGIIGLATGARLVAETLAAVALWLPAWGIEQLRAIERTVLDLRAALLRRFTEGIVAWADRAIDLAAAFERVAGANIAFLVRFARRLGEEFLTGVGTFAKGLDDFLRGLVKLFQAVPAIVGAVTGFDMSELIKYGWLHWLFVPGPLALDRLLNKDGTEVNVELAGLLSHEIDEAAEKAKDLLDLPAGELLYREAMIRLNAGRKLVEALFPGWSGPGPHTIEIPDEAPKLQFKSNAPQLYDALLGGGRAQKLTDFLDRLGESAGHAVDELGGHAHGLLDAAALEFQRQADAAKRLGSPPALGRLREQATAIFPPAAPAERRVSPLDSWLAGGGFAVIGRAIEGYGAEIADRWQARVEAGAEPAPELTETSPLILRRRAVVGRVALPRLRMHVPAGRALDAQLADEVADRFAAAMRDAYATADRRRLDLAGAP